MGATGFTNTMKVTVGGKTLLGSLKKTKFEEALSAELDPPTCLSIRLVGHSFPLVHNHSYPWLNLVLLIK